jgi:hypothetical protein
MNDYFSSLLDPSPPPYNPLPKSIPPKPTSFHTEYKYLQKSSKKAYHMPQRPKSSYLYPDPEYLNRYAFTSTTEKPRRTKTPKKRQWVGGIIKFRKNREGRKWESKNR